LSTPFSLDDLNRKIITLLQNEPGMTQSELAKKIGVSQSAIAARLRKLRENQMVSSVTGVNLSAMGMQMSRIDVSTDKPATITKFASRCPLFINGSVGVGDRNLSLFFSSEDIEMFQYIVDGHIRKLDGVKDVSFVPILTWVSDFVSKLEFDVQKSKSPPCGMLPYCPRCPANPEYDGNIWDHNGKSAFVSSERQNARKTKNPRNSAGKQNHV
jgi:DNA-binding Lrp family transcriptional regulator